MKPTDFSKFAALAGAEGTHGLCTKCGERAKEITGPCPACGGDLRETPNTEHPYYIQQFMELGGALAQHPLGKLIKKFFIDPPAKAPARLCPKCGSKKAFIHEDHPDTDMNEMVGRCPDCKYEGEPAEFKKVAMADGPQGGGLDTLSNKELLDLHAQAMREMARRGMPAVRIHNLEKRRIGMREMAKLVKQKTGAEYTGAPGTCRKVKRP